MQINLLSKLFGTGHQWHGPLTVVVDAEASVLTMGTDSIIGGGAKTYAPRIISGRIQADAVCLMAEENALLLIQVHRIRQATGEDLARQLLSVVSPAHVAAIEFPDVSPLARLGVGEPPAALLAAAVRR